MKTILSQGLVVLTAIALVGVIILLALSRTVPNDYWLVLFGLVTATAGVTFPTAGAVAPTAAAPAVPAAPAQTVVHVGP